MPWDRSSPARNHFRRELLRLAGRALAPALRAAPAQPRRVLVVRPDHVGDVLLSAPALALLRASLPAARLTYLVGPWAVEAARNGPPVDDLRTLDFPGFTRQPNANVAAPYALLVREASTLRRQRFDLAVVLRGDHWWGALLALAAGVPLRVGGATPETSPLLTHAVPQTTAEPAAKQALAIARLAISAFGATPTDVGDVPQFVLADRARHAAEVLLQRHNLGSRRFVAIQPNAGAPLKSWPHERWARLADALIALGVDVALVGAPGDTPRLEAIAAAMTGCAPRLCGQSLEVSAGVYARSALVVGVDSGACHLAAAVGTPTLRIFGPAPVSAFGPWPARLDQHVVSTHGLACAPCGRLENPPCGAAATPACMLAVQVEDVLNEARVELDRS